MSKWQLVGLTVRGGYYSARPRPPRELLLDTEVKWGRGVERRGTLDPKFVGGSNRLDSIWQTMPRVSLDTLVLSRVACIISGRQVIVHSHMSRIVSEIGAFVNNC